MQRLFSVKKGLSLHISQFVRLDNFVQLCPERFIQIGRDVKEDDKVISSMESHSCWKKLKK